MEWHRISTIPLAFDELTDTSPILHEDTPQQREVPQGEEKRGARASLPLAGSGPTTLLQD
jgi:hypothetical protein